MRTCRLGRSGACGVKAGAAAPLPALRGPREEGARGFPQRRWAPRADRTCETTGRWRAVCKASWCVRALLRGGGGHRASRHNPRPRAEGRGIQGSAWPTPTPQAVADGTGGRKAQELGR